MPISYLKDFERWDFYSPIENKLKMVDASDTPFITYDNGVPCHEANMYMQKQLVAQRSRRIKGGTLKTYANQIIHLVRFCYNNRIRFSQLTDARFTLFVQGLQGERDKYGELVRSNNHVRQIVQRCLDFLDSVQYCHDLDSFIGVGKENQIRVKIKKYQISIEGSNYKKKVEILTHVSMPTKDAVKRRLPVSDDSALKVWEYIQEQPNRVKRMRDSVIYQCLEQLGGRISEIHLITVNDIENAVNSGVNPFLVLTTLKRKDGNEKRNLPVTLTFLSSVMQYIKKARRKVINNTIGKAKDHGYLFVSLTTGKALQSDSTTHAMNIWKKEAGVEGEFHPHLFRHAFISNKLKEIILQHKEITSADKFREHLLHTERFKMQLKQWTGHTHSHSLDTYINLVFADLSGYSKIYNAVQLNDSVKVMKQQLEQLKRQLKSKSITPTEGVNVLDESLDAFELDIKSALRP
jgi:integrase